MWTVRSWYEDARQYSAARAANYRGLGDVIFANYLHEMPGRSRQDVLTCLDESNRKRLDALPDLTRYPELRGMRELVDAQWRGTRDGAQLNPEQSAALCDYHFYVHRYIHGAAFRTLGCSYVFFPDSDRGPILGNNLDSSPSEPAPAPEWIACNEHLIVGGVSSGIFGDEESPEIFPAPVHKLVARYCRSTDEAVELFKRYNHFWGPCNTIVIDRAKNVAMIEKSACRIGVRRSTDGFGFITAMTAEEPGMRAFLRDRRAHSLKVRGLPETCADTAYWSGADRRSALMAELLDEARRNPTVEKLRQIMQFRDPGRGQVCYNGEILFPGGSPCEFTLRTSLWLLREGRAMWWQKEGDRPSFENRKEDVRYEDAWRWN